jgi:hypothetical protein
MRRRPSASGRPPGLRRRVATDRMRYATELITEKYAEALVDRASTSVKRIKVLLGWTLVQSVVDFCTI